MYLNHTVASLFLSAAALSSAPSSFLALVSICHPCFRIHLLSPFNSPYLVCAPLKSGCCFGDEYSGAEWVAICLLSIIDPWLTRVQQGSQLQPTKKKGLGDPGRGMWLCHSIAMRESALLKGLIKEAASGICSAFIAFIYWEAGSQCEVFTALLIVIVELLWGVLFMMKNRGKSSQLVYPRPTPPPRQPSVSLRETFPQTALQISWSWCILTLMVHTTDLWAVEVHSNNTCCMCLRPWDGPMRMSPLPADFRSECQDAAAATRALTAAARLTQTG